MDRSLLGIVVGRSSLVQILEHGHGTDRTSRLLLGHADLALKGDLGLIIHPEAHQLTVMTLEDAEGWKG